MWVQFTDPDTNRYQVPKEAVDIVYNMSSTPSNNTRLYDVVWVSEPQFGLKVKRRSTGTVMLVVHKDPQIGRRDIVCAIYD